MPAEAEPLPVPDTPDEPSPQKNQRESDKDDESDGRQNGDDSNESKAPNKDQDGQCSSKDTDSDLDDDPTGEFEMGNFIRIRSQDDGIFEQDDDEFDDDFPMPEVILSAPPSRKRKQDLCFKDNNIVPEFIDLDGEVEEEDINLNEPTYTIDPQLFATRRRDRMPLYLLNPEDYGHDPKKQIQIRRAIITYRHHQEKKEQIIRLTDENKKLRAHIDKMTTKMLALKNCGCSNNERMSLDELDVKIPIVPPRMYVRGNKPVLAVPYNASRPHNPHPVHSTQRPFLDKVKTEPAPSNSSNIISTAPPSTTPSPPKPLINVGTSRLVQISNGTLTGPTTMPKLHPVPNAAPKPQDSHVGATIANGKPKPGAPPPLYPTSKASRYLQILTTNTPPTGNVPPVSASPVQTIKVEPGLAPPRSTPAVQIPSKVEDSPATASPVSRIVFARRQVTTASTGLTPSMATASQLLFGKKSILTGSNLVPAPSQPVVKLTASQLALHAQVLKGGTTTLSQSGGVMSPSAKIFRTASGQVLKVVQTPPSDPQRPRASTATGFIPILPKVSQADVKSLPTEKSKVLDLWKKFDDDDDDDDDEKAILAAMNGTPPPPRNRKQTMSKLPGSPVIMDGGKEIELNKYEDIVFEEAD